MTDYSIKNLAGVLILAGGLSTRMGSPKALLELPTGQTLLDYHVAQAKSLGVPILIADNEQGFIVNGNSNINQDENSLSKSNSESIDNTQLPIAHIKDYKPTRNSNLKKEKHSAGPLSAITAGLQYLKDTQDSNPKKELSYKEPSYKKWMLVISCDSLISAPDVWQLIQNDIEAIIDSSKQIVCLNDDNNLYPLLAMYQLPLADELKAYLDDGQRRVMGFVKPKCHMITMPQVWSDLSNLNTPVQFEKACQQVFNITLTNLTYSK